MTESKKRTIAILGSTGSIGTQTLQVVDEHPECFEVYALTANDRVDELIEQARKYQPEAVVIANETKYEYLKEALQDMPIKVYGGYEAICQIVQSGPIDVVVTALVGFSGLRPTIEAIKAGKAIALANKETMVVAGELINELAMKHEVPILPVDSEHSAIFQCLAGEGAEQCGFCAPGMMMNVFALAKENPNATDDEIDAYLAGNLCRCSGYVSQRRAVKKYLAMKAQEVRT